MFHVNNKNRVRNGVLGSMDKNGNNGVFQFNRIKYKLRTIVSEGMGWEHVSVTRSDNKMPTWLDMCYLKSKFWDDADVVMQLHPAKSDWISNHDKCLHLWRPTNTVIPMPPAAMVGIKGIDSQEVQRMSLEQKEQLLIDANQLLIEGKT